VPSDSSSGSATENLPWWELDTWPGTKRPLGDEPRIAAWLAANKRVGDTFTTDELRKALGHRLSETSRNDREHFQRRIRELRSVRDGWAFPSIKHDKTVDSGNYRLDKIGWHPALGKRPPNPTAVSAKVKREVLERDHYRCFHCGVVAGEPYPDDPDTLARMTVGHVVPAEFGGTGKASNLRAECAHCNEASRSATSTPESLPGVKAAVNNLGAKERVRLLEWIAAGRRGRDSIDETYDRARLLSPGDREELLSWLQQTTK
jgi:hypothetical protein